MTLQTLQNYTGKSTFNHHSTKIRTLSNFSSAFHASNVTIGVMPLLSPDYISLRNGLRNSFFHSFPTGFIEYERSLQQLHISSHLISPNSWPPLLLTRTPFYCHWQSWSNLLVLLLLLISGVEVNPSPSSAGPCLGVLNVRSTVIKAPLLHSLIPPVIQNGLAPLGYYIFRVHRKGLDRARGGNLAEIHQGTINVEPRLHNILIYHIPLSSLKL